MYGSEVALCLNLSFLKNNCMFIRDPPRLKNKIYGVTQK